MKRTALALVLLLCSGLRAGAETLPTALYTSVIAVNAGDLFSTHLVLTSGRGYEANPIMANKNASYALKATTTTLEVLAVRQLWNTKHRTASVWLAIGLTVGHGYVISHNLSIAGGK